MRCILASSINNTRTSAMCLLCSRSFRVWCWWKNSNVINFRSGKQDIGIIKQLESAAPPASNLLSSTIYLGCEKNSSQRSFNPRRFIPAASGETPQWARDRGFCKNTASRRQSNGTDELNFFSSIAFQVSPGVKCLNSSARVRRRDLCIHRLIPRSTAPASRRRW